VDADAGVLGRALGTRAARLVAFIGFYSYSIYLWHFLVREQFVHHLHSINRSGASAYFLMTGADIALATAVGVLSSNLIEQPFLALRDRLFPSRTPSGAVAPPDASDPTSIKPTDAVALTR
jgi:peptidoglycan/LPS O-acetylase OafA/YrhL